MYVYRVNPRFRERGHGRSLVGPLACVPDTSAISGDIRRSFLQTQTPLQESQPLPVSFVPRPFNSPTLRIRPDTSKIPISRASGGKPSFGSAELNGVKGLFRRGGSGSSVESRFGL